MLPFLASFARWLRWTSLGGRSLPKGNSLPSRSSALPSGKISGESIPKNSFLAVRTGLEPATPGVTGRYSNQLNYRTNLFSLMRFSRTRMQRYAFFCNLQIFLAFFEKKLQKNGGRTIAALPPVAFGITKNSETQCFRQNVSYLTSMTRFSSSIFSFVVFGITI